ncbi:MAG: hypothetical protein FWB86_05275 [Treponema sp.]|nr:hypothetical protein [Treponema sp.]
MIENDKLENDTPTKKKIRLFFGDAKGTQKTIARLIRARYRGAISDFEYKSLLYGFNIWLAFSKHIKDIDIEKQMQEIEHRLEILTNANK